MSCRPTSCLRETSFVKVSRALTHLQNGSSLRNTNIYCVRYLLKPFFFVCQNPFPQTPCDANPRPQPNGVSVFSSGLFWPTASPVVAHFLRARGSHPSSQPGGGIECEMEGRRKVEERNHAGRREREREEKKKNLPCAEAEWLEDISR